MRAKSIAIFLVVGLWCVLVAQGPAGASDEKDEVNRFYGTLVQTLKEPLHVKAVLALVEKNPRVAERCLAVLKQKAQLPGDQAAAMRMLYGELCGALLLVAKPPKCDDDCVKPLLSAIRDEGDDDDRIRLLEMLVSRCPGAGEAHSKLGDLYLGQKRCAMAIAAYERAVELTGDEDSRKLLEEARECNDNYVNQKPIHRAEVRDLVARGTTMGPKRTITRKARVGSSIQRQILFDAWSFRIKDQYLPDLKVIGESLKEDLSKDPNVRIVIEGHTDKRGELEKNMQLSKERAQALKNHLVQNFGIDSSQLVTEGYGPTRPYSPEDNETGWGLNRRVEFKKAVTNQ